MLSLSPRVAAAAGEDYTDAVRISWQLVEVVVPPGPLGILLDSAERSAAVLEGFAAVDASGARGAVELHGGVLPGSILVRVNQYELTDADMTFAEIGQVLRETAHLERTLCFKVPVPVSKSAPSPPPQPSASATKPITTVPLSPPPQAADAHWSDEAELAQELALVSPASVGLPDHSGVSLSPPPVASQTTATPAERAFDELADTALPPPSPSPDAPASAPPASTKKAWGFTMPKSLPKGMPNLPKGMPNLPTIAALKAPFNMAPSSVSTLLFDDVSTTSSTTGTTSGTVIIEDHYVVVDAPSGPLGLNLDGAVLDHAVVVGFAPLPDGSRGAVETHGGVVPGAVLTKINGEDVSAESLEQIRARLGALSAGPTRALEFRVRRAAAVQAKPRAAPVPLVEDLEKRRKLELALVIKHDKAVIDRHECWFVLDALWMTTWVNFAARGGPLPGPISNERLLIDNWEARLDSLEPGRPDATRAGLKLSKDYRCVTPMVWCLFVELHGTSRAPVLPRYVLDIDAEAAGDSDVATILRNTHLKAAALVSDLRDKCVVRS